MVLPSVVPLPSWPELLNPQARGAPPVAPLGATTLLARAHPCAAAPTTSAQLTSATASVCFRPSRRIALLLLVLAKRRQVTLRSNFGTELQSSPISLVGTAFG